jgi:hypothetical protein
VNENEIRETLIGVDAPRSPRPEFARDLLDRLLHGDTAVAVAIEEVEEERPAPRNRGWFRAASIAAALVVIVGLAVFVGSRDREVEVSGNVSIATADAACRAFTDATFGGVTGPELIGPGNKAALSDPTIAATRVAAFERATRQLQADLRAAGVKSASLDSTFAEILRYVSDVQRLIATGQLAPVPRRLGEVEPVFIEIERELTKMGVVYCVAWSF